MELIENLINRNKEDMKRINLLMKSLGKLKSKEVAGVIQNILIQEVIKLGEQNKQLKLFLDEQVIKSRTENEE